MALANLVVEWDARRHMRVFPTTTPKSLLRWLSPIVLALAIVPAIASCGPTSGGGPGATALCAVPLVAAHLDIEVVVAEAQGMSAATARDQSID